MNSIPSAVLQDLAPSGKMRASINFGNPVLAQKDPVTGEPRGVSVDLARELGKRLGVPVELVTFDAAGKVFEAIKTGAWDVAFLARDPLRAAEILFTAPYVIIEGTYMVPVDSPLRTIDGIDREGVRIAVAKGSAYELHLSRTVKHAELVKAPTGSDAIELFVRDRLEVAAGVKGPLIRYAQTNPALRVMEGRFMVIEQAMGTLKGREQGWRYLQQFIEEMKASGFVAEGLERSGQYDAVVAPAG